MGRSEPLTSELRSYFMTESFVDRYLPGFSCSHKGCLQNLRWGFPIHRAGFARTIKVRASCPVRSKYCIVQDGVRDISWCTRRFAMHTDPSVVLCMLSRALRSLRLLPTCTLIFTLFFRIKVDSNVNCILRCYWDSRELYKIDG